MSDQTPGVPPTPLPPTHQSTYEPTSSYESPGYQALTYPSPTHETLTTLTPPTRRGSGVAAIVVLVLAAVVVLAGAGAGVWALSEWAGEQQGADGPGGPPAAGDPADRPPAPLISPAGFDELLDALKKETGSTSVVDLTVYPTYAIAVVPVTGGKGRTTRLYYDGSFRQQGLGTSDDPSLDLRRVDPKLLLPLSRKARNAVEDPNSWYLIIGAPDAQGAAIYAYASNAYGEGGYVAADLEGRVVNRITW